MAPRHERREASFLLVGAPRGALHPHGGGGTVGCMATNNRTIRIDDELWGAIQRIADNNDRSASEVIRSLVMDIAGEKPCFNCGAPSDYTSIAAITPAWDNFVGFDELHDRPRRANRTPVTLRYFACDSCQPGVARFLKERPDVGNSVGTILTGSDLYYSLTRHHYDDTPVGDSDLAESAYESLRRWWEIR